MIRVLHLFDRDADLQTRRAIDTLVAHPVADIDQRQMTIGAGGSYRNAFTALLGLFVRTPGADVVHAWGRTALMAATIGWRGKMIFTPTEPLGKSPERWVRSGMEYRDLHVICPTEIARRTLVQRGVDAQRCHLIQPGVDFSKIRRRRNVELRKALGFQENDVVLLGAGESTRNANHEDAAWTAAILHVFDKKYRLLLWGKGDRAAALEKFARRMRQNNPLCMATRQLGRDIEYEELFSAADLIIVPAAGAAATLGVAIAMASALPIVATVTPVTAELLEDRHTALMVPGRAPRVMAQRILELLGDSALQWRLADTARTEAYQFFSQTRFVEEHRKIYRELATGPQ